MNQCYSGIQTYFEALGASGKGFKSWAHSFGLINIKNKSFIVSMLLWYVRVCQRLYFCTTGLELVRFYITDWGAPRFEPETPFL